MSNSKVLMRWGGKKAVNHGVGDVCEGNSLSCRCNFFFRSDIHEHSRLTEQPGEVGGYLFNSSLPVPLASQTLRHWPGDYCRELTSAYSQQPNSNREPLMSERKSVTIKLLSSSK